MEAQRGPQLDTDELRTLYGTAIASYEQESGRLRHERVDVATSDFGTGFAAQGTRIVRALDRLHDTSLQYLSARTTNWESILKLVDDVVNHDNAGSASLRGVTW